MSFRDHVRVCFPPSPQNLRLPRPPVLSHTSVIWFRGVRHQNGLPKALDASARPPECSGPRRTLRALSHSAQRAILSGSAAAPTNTYPTYPHTGLGGFFRIWAYVETGQHSVLYLRTTLSSHLDSGTVTTMPDSEGKRFNNRESQERSSSFSLTPPRNTVIGATGGSNYFLCKSCRLVAKIKQFSIRCPPTT